MTNLVELNTADKQQVETVLGHLANKVYYTNYVHEKRNLTGTVGIAAHVDAGRYAMQGMGVSNESTYTRF